MRGQQGISTSVGIINSNVFEYIFDARTQGKRTLKWLDSRPIKRPFWRRLKWILSISVTRVIHRNPLQRFYKNFWYTNYCKMYRLIWTNRLFSSSIMWSAFKLIKTIFTPFAFWLNQFNFQEKSGQTFNAQSLKLNPLILLFDRVTKTVMLRSNFPYMETICLCSSTHMESY